MKIVTATGYYATGSSAVTNLLEEYDNINSLGSDFECRIAHDIFGLSDLEYNLVDNLHRHNSSTAINNFKRLMRIYGLDRKIRLENYPAYIGKDFKKYVDEYINDLAPIVYMGGSHIDIYTSSDISIFFLKLRQMLYLKFHKYNFTYDDKTYLNHKRSPIEKEVDKFTSYIYNPQKNFLEVTKKFTQKLFCRHDSSKYDYLIVDQLIPPTNPSRYIRYFEDARVICVDRDPRDIYYLEKYYFKGNIIPTKVAEFIEWYKATRYHRNYEVDDTSRVLRIYFEDLVLNYDTTVSQIENFLNLSPKNHIKPQSIFNPELSKNNIGKWKGDSNEEANIKKIEEELILTGIYNR